MRSGSTSGYGRYGKFPRGARGRANPSRATLPAFTCVSGLWCCSRVVRPKAGQFAPSASSESAAPHERGHPGRGTPPPRGQHPAAAKVLRGLVHSVLGEPVALRVGAHRLAAAAAGTQVAQPLPLPRRQAPSLAPSPSRNLLLEKERRASAGEAKHGDH